MEYLKTSGSGRGRVAMFQAKPQQINHDSRVVMFILNTHMDQDTRKAKLHKMEYYK